MDALKGLAINLVTDFAVKLAINEITDDECIELADKIADGMIEKGDKLLGEHNAEKVEDLMQHKLGLIAARVNQRLDADDGE